MSVKQLRVMVVDAHAAFRKVVRGMLETADWECIECDDGQQAVEQYAQTKPDLVLMEIAMPHLDGIRATAQIKARFPAARIMMLTQYSDSELRAAADRAGACGYILKENLLSLQTAIQAQTPATNNGSSAGSNFSVTA